MSDTFDSFDTARGPGQPSRRTTADSRFIFATFNILHGATPGRGVNPDAFRSAVVSLRPDVLALQEVDKRMVRSRWLDQTAFAGRALRSVNYFGRARRRWDLGQFGNALLSKHPMYDVEVRRLPRASWRRERRVAVIATVVLGGQAWRVASVHLSLHRDESEPQLRQLLTELGEWDGPAVIMGDFNRRDHEVHDLVRAAGWQVEQTPPTYPSKKPELVLDYVLTRNCSVVHTEVRSMKISDHCSLAVVIAPSRPSRRD